MVDPISIAEGALLAKALLEHWLKSGELDRLLGLLDQRFGDETGLSLTQLQSWKEDDRFVQILAVISTTGDWDSYREALRGATLSLLAADPQDPHDHETDLSDQVVAAIEELLPRAKQGDELTRYMGKETRLAIEQQTAKALRIDLAPERARDFLEELADKFPSEALRLQQSLEGGDSETAIRGLLRDPPPWIAAEGSGLLWETLAATAEGTGQWELALDAWREAVDRPAADRTRALVRASTAAYVLGKGEEGERLLSRAEESVILAPSSVKVATWNIAPSGWSPSQLTLRRTSS